MLQKIYIKNRDQNCCVYLFMFVLLISGEGDVTQINAVLLKFPFIKLFQHW